MVDIERYRKGLAECFQLDELSYQLGLLLEQLGYWEEATHSYQDAITQNQQHVEAHLSLGMLWELKGSPKIAIAIYRQAINNKIKDARIYNNLGYVLAKQKAFIEAILIYQQALEIGSDSAVIYNNLGRTFLESEQIEQAFTAFEQAINLDPHLASAHYNLGYLWKQRGDDYSAATHFQKVIELEPNNLRAYGHYSNILINQGKLRQAIDCLRQAIIQQPTWIDNYCQRTHQLHEDNLLDKAQLTCIDFLQNLRQSSDISLNLNKLEQTYRAFGDVFSAVYEDKRAESYYQKAIQAQPQNIDLYWHLGNTLIKQQRTEAAIAIYQLGLTLDKTHAHINFSLGNLLASQQRFAEALHYYEQVLQSNKEFTVPLLPSPFINQPLQLPQGIFEFTQNWISRTKIADCHYQIIDHSCETSIKTVEETPSALSPQVSPPSCQGINCNSCMTDLCHQFEPIAIASGVYQVIKPASMPLSYPSTFVVSMPEGRLWTTPKKSSWMPCKAIAVITPDNYLLSDLSRDYPWYLPGCQKHDPAIHGMFRRNVLPPLKSIQGTVVALTGLSGHMYYHWMMDILPRLNILQRSNWADEPVDWYLINTIEQDFQRETLTKLGIKSEQLLSSDQYPYIQATKLIIPSFPGHPHWATPESINFLRNHFFNSSNTTSLTSPKRLYISRSNANHRQIINEIEVKQLLESMGFLTVFPEQYSLAEQVNMFQNAEIIVAPHGGGLTNLIFCRPGTKIIEFFSPNYIRTDYWVISVELELQHYYIKGKNFDCTPLRKLMYQSSLTEDIWLDIKLLKLALEVVLNDSVSI
ncbi:capsular biosynthesis protein [Aphanothece hegewaldii CCALA 016]|uniref:Capsular biosynthesis protein n=1 Tax=Aphanothece hegewaldii CCALA 016 TaxID=2107694 RepID=A0A2T1M3U9_9CHRO|nr:glycosyltransferase 61 family protein [Aphanothece hegewaldii]PSF39492.1 capsular biosynthesis protein [Aphanothece hegewaldii CCALA 016]